MCVVVVAVVVVVGVVCVCYCVCMLFCMHVILYACYICMHVIVYACYCVRMLLCMHVIVYACYCVCMFLCIIYIRTNREVEKRRYIGTHESNIIACVRVNVCKVCVCKSVRV